jgi:hypothetical protein
MSGGETPKRKPGAQPGNLNALKHGFYSRRFKEAEKRDLAAHTGGLEDEIAMLRVSIRRLLEWTPARGERVELAEAVARLNALGQAAARLAGLLRTQKRLAEGAGEVSSALSQALDEVMKELKT